MVQHFTAKSKSGTHVFGEVPQYLEEAEQQAEASGDIPPPLLQTVISTPFCLFPSPLYPLSAPFLNPLSSPNPHFP